MQIRLMAELESRKAVDDEELWELIDHTILEFGQEEYIPLKEKMDLRVRLFDGFRRLGILQELVDDRKVTEIMVNGQDRIFIEREGRMFLWDKSFDSQEQLEDMIQQIVSRVNRMVNVSNPIVDARLEDGSRVHVVLPPVSLDGPAVTIRKFPEPITMEKLVCSSSITAEGASFLQSLVRAGYNIFISGGTNSGKTTFLNALSAFIPQEERVITIEDSAELQIQQVPNLVRLEARNANSEGEGQVTIRDLIRAALRMNPDRIIVGEVRSGEAFDLLTAFNTGHSGMGTGHANSPEDMLSRLESMVLMAADLPLTAIRSQICAAIDVLIHLGRLRDRSRRVLAISEVLGMSQGEIQLNPLFVFQEEENLNGGGIEKDIVERERREGKGEGKMPETRNRKAGAGKESGERVEGRLVQVGKLQKTEKLKAAGCKL
ncbi:MAG TPA: CpaF family protein [Candidatus Cottocaccamicrobium excrementipullorum]|nr:CpaF family protein [Candidatus Cottocaccamicrobium excrementipullorum]